MQKLKIFNNEVVQNVISNDESVLSYADSNFHKTIKNIQNSTIGEINVYQLYPTDELSAELFRILQPKCKISFHYCIKDREAGQILTNDLKIQGFVDIMVAKDTSTEDRFLVCQKPEFDYNKSVGIKLKPTNISKAVPSVINNNGDDDNKKTWKMALNDLTEDDLVDENDLLKDDIVVPSNTNDCGTGNSATAGVKRACANCTCGLAEQEQLELSNNGDKVVATAAKSACGNCYKGDAFRCGGCPFLGKPAFEPGKEKLVLSLSDDM